MTSSSRQQRRIRYHIENLANADGEASCRAERCLIRYYGARALEPLIEMCEHSIPAARYRAAWALGHTNDPRAFETLVRLTNDPDESVRYDATVALGILGDPRALTPLAEMLRLEDASRPAAYALARLGLQSIPTLERLLADSNACVRLSVVNVLGGFAEEVHDPRSIELLRSIAGDPDEHVRTDVAYWLSLSEPVHDSTEAE